MKMMSKLSLVALAMCAATSVAHAEDKSYGTASAKVTVNAMQEWKIEKVQDGNLYLDSHGKVFKNGSQPASAANPKFKITNDTTASSLYYIQGTGTSLGSDEYIYAVKDDDTTKKFFLKVAHADISGDGGVFGWNAENNKWVSRHNLDKGSSESIELRPMDSTGTAEPGAYTVSIELFAPSV